MMPWNGAPPGCFDAGKPGTEWHTDTTDIFVLQTVGSKKWILKATMDDSSNPKTEAEAEQAKNSIISCGGDCHGVSSHYITDLGEPT